MGRLAFDAFADPDQSTLLPGNATVFEDDDIPNLPECYSFQFNTIIRLMLRADPVRRPDAR